MDNVKKVLGGGRLCNSLQCNLRLAPGEEALEVDGKVYHLRCNPLKQKPTVRIKALTAPVNQFLQ